MNNDIGGVSNINKTRIDAIEKTITIKKIKDLLIQNHSFGMIYDLIKRDFFKILDVLPKTKSGFIKFMHRNDFSFDLKQYNKQQNWFKLQYRYPKNTSIECLKSIQKAFAQDGQKKTIEIRKKQVLYHPEYGIQYWIDITGNEDQAKIALDKYKKERSPFCIEFYLKRGFTESQGKQEILKLHCMGALACLKKIQKPKTETKIKEILEKNNIEFVTQYKVKLKKDEQKFRKRFYLYDFYIPSKNLLIDCNGTYWHCDPRIYSANDMVKFPGREPISVSLIWEVDAHRKVVAKNKNYNYDIIWEIDLCGNINEKIMGIL